MHNRTPKYLLLACAIAALLLIKFGSFIALSGDMTQHFMLVNEIMNHGGVRPDAAPLLTSMYAYPPAAHWLAAIVGWIGGSGLVGIALVTILAAYACYLLIGLLLASDSALAVFAALFCALMWTHSMIGWEVIVNYFYPQLVGDVAYFAALLWLTRMDGLWRQAALIIGAGIATIWIQPLNALHILGTGMIVLLFGIALNWRTVGLKAAASLPVVAALSLLAIKLHPSFRAISVNANHEGYLEFGYPHILAVAALCGLIGLANLWRAFTVRGDRHDGVLGAAAVAAVGLVFMQFAALKLLGTGSNYAVKKHMFIVITVAMMNVARIAAAYLGARRLSAAGRLAIPIGAGLASVVVLQSLNTPVAPVLKALDYANHAVKYALPGFVPGNTVDDDRSQPQLINFMVTNAMFQHNFDGQAASWLSGADPKIGARYAMVLRTTEIDSKCERFAESATYVIVETACLPNPTGAEK